MIPITLYRYLTHRFLGVFAVIYSGLLSVIYLFETVEILRRLAKRGNIEFDLVITIGLYKLPEIGLQVVPFAVFYATVYMLWTMSRQSELAVIRASGVSAWQFLSPLIITAFLIGVLKVTAINPLAAVLVKQYEIMEARHLSRTGSLVNLSETGLWLKQPFADRTMIIHAPQVELPQWHFKNPIIFYFNLKHQLTTRIDAPYAKVVGNQLQVEKAMIHQSGEARSEFAGTLTVETEMTSSEIEQRFSSPRTISFWAMPSYVEILKNAGFPTNPLRARFFKLLFEPLLYVGMLFLGAGISMSRARVSKGMRVTIASVSVPVLVFFLGDLLQALGISEKLPLVLASGAPALITLMIGVWVILHLEDG